jgi:hypothetical protein
MNEWRFEVRDRRASSSRSKFRNAELRAPVPRPAETAVRRRMLILSNPNLAFLSCAGATECRHAGRHFRFDFPWYCAVELVCSLCANSA